MRPLQFSFLSLPHLVVIRVIPSPPCGRGTCAFFPLPAGDLSCLIQTLPEDRADFTRYAEQLDAGGLGAVLGLEPVDPGPALLDAGLLDGKAVRAAFLEARQRGLHRAAGEFELQPRDLPRRPLLLRLGPQFPDAL